MIVALIALVLWFVLPQLRRIRDHETGDFGHFYFAAKAMAAGEDIYSSWKRAYIYPPLIAFLYLPLASLTEETAALLALGINTVLLLLAAWMSARELIARFGARDDHWTMVGALVLAGMVLMADKIKGELQMWQTNVLMLLMFALLTLRLLDRWPVLAGPRPPASRSTSSTCRWSCCRICSCAAAGSRSDPSPPASSCSRSLPAVFLGWDVSLGYLAVAYRGLFRVFGIPVGPDQAANLPEHSGQEFSVSITSAAFAREFGSEDSLRLLLCTRRAGRPGWNRDRVLAV